MNKIKINVKLIRENIKRIPGKIQFVMKSNTYGFGNKLISYIDDLISSIVTTDYNEYLLIEKEISKKIKMLLLYENDLQVLDKTENVYICINNFKMLNKVKDLDKCYLRIDPYLGLHGLENIPNYICCNKFLIHINEYLCLSEQKDLALMLNYTQKKGYLISVGGSGILDYIKKEQMSEMVELRVATKILIENNENKMANFSLEVQVIN